MRSSNIERRAVRVDCGVDPDTGEVVPSLTKQSMKKDCDINVIMGRYLKSGQVDHLAKHGGHYGDFPAQTFHEAMNTVRKAEEMFADLDSAIRKRFHNDPAEFLEFVQARNEDGGATNFTEMVKLGLAVPQAAPAASSAPVGAPAGGTAASSSSAPSGGQGGAQ